MEELNLYIHIYIYKVGSPVFIRLFFSRGLKTRIKTKMRILGFVFLPFAILWF